jgi:hypothetical protein
MARLAPAPALERSALSMRNLEQTMVLERSLQGNRGLSQVVPSKVAESIKQEKAATLSGAACLTSQSLEPEG